MSETPQNTQVFSIDMLDEDIAQQFNKKWLLQYPNGEIEQFDTEEDACKRQRELVS